MGCALALAGAACPPPRPTNALTTPLLPGLPPVSAIVQIPGVPNAPQITILPTGPLRALLGVPGPTGCA